MAGTVLVTGASRGIGLATARLLAEAGHAVVGIARRAPDDFPGTFVPADLSDEAATAEACARVTERFEVDGVVNNVGFNVLERRAGADRGPAARGRLTRVPLDPTGPLSLRPPGLRPGTTLRCGGGAGAETGAAGFPVRRPDP